ncbi:hypothetical protein CYMTET_15308 [Cymbomonas tetramitiformis]|uniref:Uncharacterized protein n=1 Tax=Cymbomonas tetramitiformis TaxID=36881 RepID=A0AAE0L9A1_9CHLO|nr:hypothetical protein CYMTET_15308 [Cymbomonas tetramitiformis]
MYFRILALEQRLVRESRAPDCYVDAEGPEKVSLKRRIQLVGRVYGGWLAAHSVDQGATATSALAVGTGDEIDHKAIYKIILNTEIQTLEHFMNTGKTGAAATKAAHGHPRGGLNGFRPGLHLPGKGDVSPVAFDPKEMKAVSRCFRWWCGFRYRLLYSAYGFTVGMQSREAEEKDLLQGLVAMGEGLDAVAEAVGFSATTASFVNDVTNTAAAVSVPPPVVSGGGIAQVGLYGAY